MAVTNVYDVAVANGFDSSFVYEHTLADLTKIVLNGALDAVVDLLNTSLDGTDAGQVTVGKEPRYGLATLNGIKVASFTNQGSQQALNILGPNAAGIAGATGYSWFIVLRRQGPLTNSGGRFWSNEQPGAGSQDGVQFQERNAVTTIDSMRHTCDFLGDSGETVDVPKAIETDWVQVTGQWSPARGQIQLRVDRVDGEFNTNAAAQVQTGMVTSAYGKASDTANSNISQFDLAHFALFNADLTVPQRDAVESLMKQTWFIAPPTSIAKLAFDLIAGPAISALTEIGPAFKMDTIVEPAIRAGLDINPERFEP